MSSLCQTIAECLRTELTEYGRLLQLYEEQQARLFKRDAAGVLRLTSEIEAQVELLVRCRGKREEATAELAREQAMDEGSSLVAVIKRVSSEVKPLVEALVAEMNRLVARLRRVARHNRIFLIRTIENQQELLRRIRPGSFSKIYSPAGRVRMAPLGAAPALSAEG